MLTHDPLGKGPVLDQTEVIKRQLQGRDFFRASAERAAAGPVVELGDLRTGVTTAFSRLDQLQQMAQLSAVSAYRQRVIAAPEIHSSYRAHYDPETGELFERGQRTLRLVTVDSAPVVPQVVTAADHDPEALRDARRVGYRLQAVAARLASSQRVAVCHRLAVSKNAPVDVRVNGEGRGYLGGVQTCGSVWHCPVCAKKITEARRADLQAMSECVRSAGGQLLMLTLTVPHQREDDLKDMLARLKAAYRNLVSGKRALSTLLSPWEYLGTVRGLEVTFGGNGWHPHLHVVLAVGVPLSEDEVLSLQVTLFDRWDKAAQHHGFTPLSAEHGVRLEAGRVAGLDHDPITDYLAKWGVAEELSKLHTKTGKAGRTPWQLLNDADQGDTLAAGAWKTYARCFKGSRQLVWSRGFRALVGLGEDITDEVLAAAEPEAHTVIRVLLRVEWIAVRACGDRSTLCDLAEFGRAYVDRYILECLQKWRDLCAAGGNEAKVAAFFLEGNPAPDPMYKRFKRPSRASVFCRVFGQRIFK